MRVDQYLQLMMVDQNLQLIMVEQDFQLKVYLFLINRAAPEPPADNDRVDPGLPSNDDEPCLIPPSEGGRTGPQIYVFPNVPLPVVCRQLVVLGKKRMTD